MPNEHRQTRWAWALPLIVGAVVAAVVLVWTWDDLPWSGEAAPQETPSPADVPTAPGEAAAVEDGAAPPPDEDVLLWREALGRDPAWIDDLTDPLDCAAVTADMNALGATLDGRDYLARWNLEDGSESLIVFAARELAARPPVVSGENRELDLVLSNAFHLFRVLGRDRLSVLREIERREQRLVEPAMMTLFRWAMSRQKCGEDEDRAMREAVVYDYAAFLLRSLGGQAYLRRRSPRVESLATFYAVTALDGIIDGGHDPLYLDIRPDLGRARDLVRGQDLRFRDRYLEVLDAVAARWQTR